MNNLLWRTARRYGTLVWLSVIILAAFQFFACAIVSSLDTSGFLARLVTALPPTMRSVLGERLFAGFTPGGMLAFGWNHPVVQALGGALAIVLATRAISGEIGAGTLELVLAGPLTRRRYFSGIVIYAIGALVALSLLGSFSSLVGMRIFNLPAVPISAFGLLAASFLLLQLSWFGLALLASVWSGEGARPANAVFLAAVASYFLDVVARLWTPASVLGPVSLYHYYSPVDILVNGRAPWGWAIVPGAVGLIATIAAAHRFQRRDIP